jgi:hypothetical protein
MVVMQWELWWLVGVESRYDGNLELGFLSLNLELGIETCSMQSHRKTWDMTEE